MVGTKSFGSVSRILNKSENATLIFRLECHGANHSRFGALILATFDTRAPELPWSFSGLTS